MRLTQHLGMDRETSRYHGVRAYELRIKAKEFEEKGNDRLAAKFYRKAADHAKKVGYAYNTYLQIAEFLEGDRDKVVVSGIQIRPKGSHEWSPKSLT